MDQGRNEFIAIGWIGVLSVFAAGFMLADGISDWRAGKDIAAHVILTILFLLIARSDARASITQGSYLRGWFAYRWDKPLK